MRGGEPDPGANALAYFGSELRRHRLKAGMSQPELGQACYVSGSLVRMFESAKRVPRPQFLKLADEALGVDVFAYMWRLISRETHPDFEAFEEFEREATLLREFHPTAVPGLLQTEDYARALLRTTRPDYREDQVEELVAARMQRQAILDSDEPPMLVVLLAESVLAHCVGSREVMRAQLDALIEAAQRLKVIVQIVPTPSGAGAGPAGMFTIASLNGHDGDVVYFETIATGHVDDRAETVAACAVAYQTLQAQALPSEQSLELIREHRKEYE